MAKRLYDQAMGVRSQLEASMVEVKEVQRAVLAGDLAAAAAASDRLSAHSSAAVRGANGRIWSIAESLPSIGDDLVAVRLVAEVTDQLASDVVAPASAVSLDAFRPKDGGIDLVAVGGLAPLIDQVDTGIDEARAKLAPVNRGALIEQVATGINQLDDALAEIEPMISPVREIVSVLPNALGANGPRDYLLMFQGTSEARSLGGNAAVFMIMRAEAGRLSIVQEVNSQQFRNAPPKPVVELDPEAVAVYGDKIGRYTADFTMVPDYPTAVGILGAWWEREDFSNFDAVISVDPVALSYLLAATGPVQLPTGDTLTADNAAGLLLNEVYFRYTDPLAQNAFFAAAADSVFVALTSGAFQPAGLMSALTRAAGEGRLLYWSDDPNENALIDGSRMQGVMPTSNDDQSVLGVYANDNTGSKMSYYLNMNVEACRAETAVSGTVVLNSSVTAEEANRLPRYVAGPYFEPGDISTFLVLYGPVGTTPAEITIDGATANILSSSQHLGRPAVKVEVINHLADSHEVSFTFDGLSAEAGPLDVWHSPMARETAVTLTDSCKH